jgi:hypothetical protein
VNCTIDVTCPTCGGAVNMTGWDSGPTRPACRRGRCTVCHDDVTVIVHRTYTAGDKGNPAAPFWPLVMLVDAAMSPGAPHGHAATIPDMEVTR